MSWGSWSNAKTSSNHGTSQAPPEEDPWKAWADSWGPQAAAPAALSAPAAGASAGVGNGVYSGGAGAADDWKIVRLEAGLRVRNPKTRRAGVVSSRPSSSAGCFWVKFDDGDIGERELSMFVSEAGGLALQAVSTASTPAAVAAAKPAPSAAASGSWQRQPKHQTDSSDHWGNWKETHVVRDWQETPEPAQASRAPENKTAATEWDSWQEPASSWSSSQQDWLQPAPSAPSQQTPSQQGSWLETVQQAPAQQGWSQSAPSAPSRGAEGGKGEGKEGQRPDLYIGDVPGHYDKDLVVAMHAEAGLDISSVLGVKLLPQKSTDHPTRSVIVNYADWDVADAALERLKSHEVSIRGEAKLMSIRFADPPKKAGAGKDKWSTTAGEWAAAAGEWAAPADEWSAPAKEWSAPANEWSAPAKAWSAPSTGAGKASKAEWSAPTIEWSAPAKEWSAPTSGAGKASKTLPEGAGTPLVVGLRVRNLHTWRAGAVTAVLTEGRLRLRFDDGEEAEREVSMFETEAGGALTEAPSTVPLVAGLRVRNWQNHRAGTVVAVSNKDFEVTFDDGEKGWRSVQMFESEDGRELTAAVPGATPPAATAVSVALGLRVKNPANGRCGVVTQAADGSGNFRVRFDEGDERTRPVKNFTAEDGSQLAEGGNGAANQWSTDAASGLDAAASSNKKGWEATGAQAGEGADWKQKTEPKKTKTDGWATGWEATGTAGKSGRESGAWSGKWGGSDNSWQETAGWGQEKEIANPAPAGTGGKGARSTTPRKTTEGKGQKRSTTPRKANQGENVTASKASADPPKAAGEKTEGAAAENSSPVGTELKNGRQDDSTAGMPEDRGAVPSPEAAIEASGGATTDVGKFEVANSAEGGGEATGNSNGAEFIDSEKLKALLEQADAYSGKVRASLQAAEVLKAAGDNVTKNQAKLVPVENTPIVDAAKDVPAEDTPTPDAAKDVPAEDVPDPDAVKDMRTQDTPEVEVVKDVPAENVPSPDSEKDVSAEDVPVRDAEKDVSAEDMHKLVTGKDVPAENIPAPDLEKDVSAEDAPAPDAAKDVPAEDPPGADAAKDVLAEDAVKHVPVAATPMLDAAKDARGADTPVPDAAGTPTPDDDADVLEAAKDLPADNSPEHEKESMPDAAATQTAFYELSPDRPEKAEITQAEERSPVAESGVDAEHDTSVPAGASPRKEESGREPVGSDAVEQC